MSFTDLRPPTTIPKESMMADYKDKLEEWREAARRKARELDEKYSIRERVEDGARAAGDAARRGAEKAEKVAARARRRRARRARRARACATWAVARARRRAKPSARRRGITRGRRASRTWAR